MSAGCTTVTYNGITILNATTRTLLKEAVYDDSGTDLLYHRCVIRVDGYFVNMCGYAKGNPLVTAIGAMGTGKQGQTANMTFSPSAGFNFLQVRHKLGEQRKQFAMAFGCNADGSGGTIVLSASAAKDLGRPTPQSPISPGTPPQRSAITALLRPERQHPRRGSEQRTQVTRHLHHARLGRRGAEVPGRV